MCANYRPPGRDVLERMTPYRWLETRSYAEEAYPGSTAPMLRRGQDGELEWCVAVFGLVPVWAPDLKFARKTYNARSETVSAKPSFRSAWKRAQFCLVPMASFYEPRYEDAKPVRWRIEREDHQVFMVAGIWDAWRAPNDDWVLSFSMLTVNADANPLMSKFHAPTDEKRSIALADQDWLSASPAAALALLRQPSPSEYVSAADPRVGKPKAPTSPTKSRAQASQELR